MTTLNEINGKYFISFMTYLFIRHFIYITELYKK